MVLLSIVRWGDCFREPRVTQHSSFAMPTFPCRTSELLGVPCSARSHSSVLVRAASLVEVTSSRRATHALRIPPGCLMTLHAQPVCPTVPQSQPCQIPELTAQLGT